MPNGEDEKQFVLDVKRIVLPSVQNSMFMILAIQSTSWRILSVYIQLFQWRGSGIQSIDALHRRLSLHGGGDCVKMASATSRIA